ncbi:ras association domain-containing protein 8b [Pristis pectinata]|uniref:ras association domain-containing protein 8b n=1 Tax=Pristis pectinata TaxID=685728 RepID=UPI00223D5956|nr:ras association domain-containing protein 8b [Pristis pectinata]XP_051889744.1 ras association domain-containing protein 8b [Pristis pectinata]XP_051889746.1 ras association domain-containing protein 8b [Pristis pectinata]XP_051889747.1 ras association domain-containing protein 8b [Pristis pectinata]XP_051889748.1 ras association domain-containing protein 8b [Pristis pectinata]XP_051889749.1 ras association domain-containing protein 8b [Pristis pectinata]
MELKVWVDGVQRIVCGVTEATTCQEVVIALAQAIGRTGRYTLIEKWRETERHLAPHENPLIALNKWGQYASDVHLILRRTGPSLSERPTSDTVSRVPERTLYRQSLPPLAKLRPQNDRSLRRKEPKRKSLTFTGGPKGFIDVFGKCTDLEVKHQSLASRASVEEFRKVVHLQKEKLHTLQRQLESNRAEMKYWEGKAGFRFEEEVLRLEQRIKKNEIEIEEEEFWENEWQIEQENEKQLKEQLGEVRLRIRDCEEKLRDYTQKIQKIENGIETEKLQQELRGSQVNEEEVKGNLIKIRKDIELKHQHSTRLQNSLRAVERTLGQANKKLQEKELELEQLTKELRQVNLQQFIQQTGTKVTVLPAEPTEEELPPPQEKGSLTSTGSLKCPTSARQLPSNLRILQNPLISGFNPEGIYV